MILCMEKEFYMLVFYNCIFKNFNTKMAHNSKKNKFNHREH
jgi:hypothetical protein